MRVTVEGKDRLFKQISHIPGLVSQAAEGTAYELAETTVGNIESRLQSEIKHNSGELAGSFASDVNVDGRGNVLASVYSNKPASWYREFGTGPNGEKSVKDLPDGINPIYTQEPWFFPVDSVDTDLTAMYGIPVLEIKGTKFYFSHGQPARPYMYPSYKDAIENLDDMATRNMNNILERGLNNGI